MKFSAYLLTLVAPFLVAACAAVGARPETVTSTGNPILSDGQTYSTDPAPLVDGDTLYILAGRDEAAEDVNDFIMNEWQLFATGDPSSGKWQHYPAIARPEQIFDWAASGRAYAGQIVKGPDGRFYFYTSVLERGSTSKDGFAIGVAVADTPAGPWRDAHPAGPIISQKVPEANTIQNIDPTVLIDDDGRVYIYWGTFGQLRGMELGRDMVSVKGSEHVIEGLTGFFEAPWIMKRKGIYYMLYAGNNAGPESPCTPAVYHACQAYGTATSPLGPWTWRGVLLKPVSSTTSHAGAVEFKGQWYLAYHTADAKGGGHFRRSVALDPMEWDDSVSPPAIHRVTPTRTPHAPQQPTRNIAYGASAVASNEPVPVQYWIRALNDGLARRTPLPPEMWGTWTGNNPAEPWIEYRWPHAVTLNGSRIWFFADQTAGSGIGIAPPASWHLEYWDDAAKRWSRVSGASDYGTAPAMFNDTHFTSVSTRCLRAVFDASQGGGTRAAVGVQEWEALSPNAAAPMPPPSEPVQPCDR